MTSTINDFFAFFYFEWSVVYPISFDSVLAVKKTKIVIFPLKLSVLKHSTFWWSQLTVFTNRWTIFTCFFFRPSEQTLFRLECDFFQLILEFLRLTYSLLFTTVKVIVGRYKFYVFLLSDKLYYISLFIIYFYAFCLFNYVSACLFSSPQKYINGEIFSKKFFNETKILQMIRIYYFNSLVRCFKK